MRTIIYTLLTNVILISCARNDSEIKWTETKNTCSIEKYQDYLIEYPQTNHLSEIIDSLRNFWKKYSIESWHHDCFGNCLSLLINKKGQLLFEGETINKNKLKEKIRYSILNPENLPNLPDKKVVTIENLGDFLVSCGVVDIITDKELDNKKYSEIIELVKESFIEIRNELSVKLYGKDLKKLNQEQKVCIETIIPIRIRFEKHIAGPPEIPLPPPDSVDMVLQQIE